MIIPIASIDEGPKKQNAVSPRWQNRRRPCAQRLWEADVESWRERNDPGWVQAWSPLESFGLDLESILSPKDWGEKHYPSVAYITAGNVHIYFDDCPLKRSVLVLVFAAEFASEGLDLKSNPGKTWFEVTLEHVDAILVCCLGFWQVSHFKTPSSIRWQVPHAHQPTRVAKHHLVSIWLMLKWSLTHHKSHH